MYTFKPSKVKFFISMLIGFLGITALFILSLALLEPLISFVISIIILTIYLYYYLYRDNITIIIDDKNVIIKRLKKTIQTFNRKEVEIEFYTDRKGKMQNLQISTQNDVFNFDLELLSNEDYSSIKDILKK